MTAPTTRLGGSPIVFGDDVNTDVIIPGRYLVSIDPAELAEHAFEPLGPAVQQRLRAADLIVAGRNFGCGSAREQAASCLVGAGIRAVLAVSFSRVFFRNAINTGLVAVECPDAVAALTASVPAATEGAQPDGAQGTRVWVDHAAGTVEVEPAGAVARTFGFAPYPAGLRDILASGGLIPYLMQRQEAPQ